MTPPRARLLLRIVALASLGVAAMGWFAAFVLTGATANIVAWEILSGFGGTLQPLFDSTPHLLVYQAFVGNGQLMGLALGTGLLLSSCTRLHRLLFRAEAVEAECRLFLRRLGYAALLAAIAAFLANVMLVTLDTRFGLRFYWQTVTSPVGGEGTVLVRLAWMSIAASSLLALAAIASCRRLRAAALIPLALAASVAAVWAVLPAYQAHTYMCSLGTDDHVATLNWLALAALVLPTLVVMYFDKHKPPL